MSEKKDLPNTRPDNDSSGKDQQRQEPKNGIAAMAAMVGLYRMRLGLGLLLVGFIIFSMQTLSASAPALPHKIFAMLLVQDNVQETSGEEPRNPDAEAEEQTETARPLYTISHYLGSPQEGFDQRFNAFVADLEFPDATQRMPVEVHQINSGKIVDAGAPTPRGEPLPGEAILTQLRLSPQSARRLLGNLIDRRTPDAGEHFLGPWSPGVGKGEVEFVPTEDQRADLQRLPQSASALQGIIISVVESMTPNAMIVSSTGDQNTGDFALTIRELEDHLIEKMNAARQADSRPAIIGTLNITDYRHGPFTYGLTIFGELLFLIGGFLLYYHLLVIIARSEGPSRGPVVDWMIDTCRLVVRHGRLYGISVGLFILFWGYGLLEAALDPARQRMMIDLIRAQFNTPGTLLGFAGTAYMGGNLLEAMAATWMVNFLMGTVVVLALPSLLPIGSAYIINAWRASIFSLALAPTLLFSGQMMGPHLLTVVLELQGYLISGFISLLLPLALYKPDQFGCEDRKQAFLTYAGWQFKALPLVGVMLLVAAVYEAIEIFLLRALF